MAVAFNPEVSVVVLVYNTEPYLSACFDSLLAQTYQNLQMICVGDGSTDSSLSILKLYAINDHRIMYFDKSNGGQLEILES